MVVVVVVVMMDDAGWSLLRLGMAAADGWNEAHRILVIKGR